MALKLLQKAAAAWPLWFRKVADRLPGTRTAAQFGKRAVQPDRQLGETWEQCFERTCVRDAPKWISTRAAVVRDRLLSAHSRHSTAPFPEVKPCYTCFGYMGSWKKLCMIMYSGDPFGTKTITLVESPQPSWFRPGAKDWDGDALWKVNRTVDVAKAEAAP
jgi:hypothetical protein